MTRSNTQPDFYLFLEGVVVRSLMAGMLLFYNLGTCEVFSVSDQFWPPATGFCNPDLNHLGEKQTRSSWEFSMGDIAHRHRKSSILGLIPCMYCDHPTLSIQLSPSQSHTNSSFRSVGKNMFYNFYITYIYIIIMKNKILLLQVRFPLLVPVLSHLLVAIAGTFIAFLPLVAGCHRPELRKCRRLSVSQLQQSGWHELSLVNGQSLTGLTDCLLNIGNTWVIRCNTW